MICEKIDLYQYFHIERPQNSAGYLCVCCHGITEEIGLDRKRPAMLVLPGGGYAYVSEREAEAVAIEYLHRGFNTFTLYYSVAPMQYPAQLREAAMAMIYIRENAERYQVAKDQVAAIGFSAGGHLCGCLGTMFNSEVLADLSNREQIRPDAVVLSYPVSIYRDDLTKSHAPSFKNLTGNNQAEMEYLSLENRIDEHSSPTFIWHTTDDSCVPAYGTLIIAQKYQEKKVPFELHVFRSGVHGLSVCTEETHWVNEDVKPWIALSVTFLKARGFKIYN